MAAIHSLGIHRPSALDHLIAESLLPPDPSPDLYTWEIFADGGVEEELLSTDSCVVWSQGRIVKKLFNFAIEKQQVQHAKLAWFQDDDDRPVQRLDESEPLPPKKRRTSGPRLHDQGHSHGSTQTSTRALVVFLQKQAHVFFLSGTSHVVHLPFEVERVFAFPRGLILQRKLSTTRPTTLASALVAPAPPQNSFLSPLPHKLPRQHLSTFTTPHSRFNSSPAGALDFDLLRPPVSSLDDDLPRHYSFTSPLSDLALIVRAGGRLKNAGNVHEQILSALDLDEDIIYVTPKDESRCANSLTHQPLLLVVTLNRAKALYSVWQATYIGIKPVSNLLTGQTTPSTGSKSRRRSSFVTATGASTPAVRPRDSVRESFGMARTHAVESKTKIEVSKKGKKLKAARASHIQEESLAAQVDPDFEPRQHTARESRRVSAMLSRADLNASFDRNAFQDLASQSGVNHSTVQAARRGQSLGAGERQSFGAASIRRLRASTPGTFSQLSIDDLSESGTVVKNGVNGSQASTTMDDFERYAELDDVAGGVENVILQNPLYGLKKELLVRKFAEIPASSQTLTSSASLLNSSANTSSQIKVLAAVSPVSCEEHSELGRRYFLIIFDHASKNCVQVEYSIRNKTTQEVDSSDIERKSSTCFSPLPSFRAMSRLEGVVDVVALASHEHSRIIMIKEAQNSHSSIWIYRPWSPDALVQLRHHRVRVFNPHDVTTVIASFRGVGAKRTTSINNPIVALQLAGSHGALDIITADGVYHQLALSLWPKGDTVKRLLEACLFILPLAFGEKLLALWWNRNLAYRKLSDAESHALVVSIFALFLACEDEKHTRRSRRSQREGLDSFEDGIVAMTNLQSRWNSSRNNQARAWRWSLEDSERYSTIRSSPKQGKDMLQAHKRASKDIFANGHVGLAQVLVDSSEVKDIIDSIRKQRQALMACLPRLISMMHLLREESKLASTCPKYNFQDAQAFVPMIVQMARWLGWSEWDWKLQKYYSYESLSPNYIFDDSKLFSEQLPPCAGYKHPPSVLQWLESITGTRGVAMFPTFDEIISTPFSWMLNTVQAKMIPRIFAIKRFAVSLGKPATTTEERVEAMLSSGISSRMLGTFAEPISTIIKDFVVQAQATPPTHWASDLLTYVSREDLKLLLTQEALNWTDGHSRRILSSEGLRDLHSISQSAEFYDPTMSFLNSERMTVSRLIFNQDRRFAEAVHMIEPYRVAVAECIPLNGWSEAQVLEAQREVHNWVMTRTFALAPGLGFAHYDSRVPLLSEKFNIHGYNTLCVMKPMNNTVSIDRTLFTEEKYAWAWFHSGVAAGLSISKHVEGIDSSWIVFNRPTELNNRHAGLLLALGLNGHLRAMAKWLAFKYLTPKHTMTSIGLLLGLAASHIGTMDTLVTRLLSVHVTRMLPPGAAELNLSALTQTAGLMGVGLLYHNTQHRRMSEVMLSEIENLEADDLANAVESVRDESYRLSAGFALGLINLGQGSDLKGLHDLRLVERLLAVVVGPRPVNLINIMDRATAGSTIALMLIFMKTENKAVAQKIDIPDTIPQFDFVRPDVLLLRTLAKHLILWKEIQPEHQFILRNLPREYTKFFKLDNIMTLRSDHMPFYNILSGLLWAISLKYAGSGNEAIRDFLIAYLDQLIRICRLPAHRYDSRLARNSVRNCQDLVALAAATVMAGTGDLALFRRLRSLHGRVHPDTPYGSHMASHMALGALFFGAGCYTFGTTNLAIASLIISFYPVFPKDVTDNKAHLQAFRHFWALAAEARCIIPRDIDTQRPLTLDLMVTLRDGTSKRITAPRILPEISNIAKIETVGSDFWPVTLDLENNADHLAAFHKHQTLHVRRRPPHEAHTTSFTATLLALNEARSGSADSGDWIFQLPAFDQFEMADVAMFLDPEERGGALLDMRGSAVDERLSLGMAADTGWDRDELWSLRILVRWADRRVLDGEKDLKWIRKEVLDRWKAILEKRVRTSIE